jgi:hypothetical protein
MLYFVIMAAMTSLFFGCHYLDRRMAASELRRRRNAVPFEDRLELRSAKRQLFYQSVTGK